MEPYAGGCRRRNHVGAAFVEASLTIREVRGIARAEAFLVRERLPAAVIQRVLHGPSDCHRSR